MSIIEWHASDWCKDQAARIVELISGVPVGNRETIVVLLAQQIARAKLLEELNRLEAVDLDFYPRSSFTETTRDEFFSRTAGGYWGQWRVPATSHGAAIIREQLPTTADNEIVVAIWMAAGANREGDWPRWKEMVESVAYGGDAGLDMFGDLPPRVSLQTRLGNSYEPWNHE